MQTAVLANGGPAIDGDDLVAGEGLADNADGLDIRRHSIDRQQHSAIDDQEVGVGCWQTAAVLIEMQTGWR